MYSTPRFPSIKKPDPVEEDFNDTDVMEEESTTPSTKLITMERLVKKQPGFSDKCLKTPERDLSAKNSTASIAPTKISFKVLNPRFPALNKLKESHAQIDAMKTPSKPKPRARKKRLNLTANWERKKRKRTVIIMDTSEAFRNDHLQNFKGVGKDFKADHLIDEKIDDQASPEGLGGPKDREVGAMNLDKKMLQNLNPHLEKSNIKDYLQVSTGITEKLQIENLPQLSIPSCANNAGNSASKSRASYDIQEILKKRKTLKDNYNGNSRYELAVSDADGRLPGQQLRLQVRPQSKQIDYSECTDFTPLMESQSSFSDEIIKKIEKLAFGGEGPMVVGEEERIFSSTKI